jgi:hypothetical protein
VFARVLPGYRVAAAAEGDQAVPTHLAHLFVATHKGQSGQRGEKVLLARKALDGPFAGGAVERVVEFVGGKGRQVAGEGVEGVPGVGLDEVLL